MSITLGTQRVGNNQFIRVIGKGKSLKRFVTQMIGGNQLIHVFDQDGKRVTSRIKAISDLVVGDKNVKRITKVLEECKEKPTSCTRVSTLSGKVVGGKIVRRGTAIVSDRFTKGLFTNELPFKKITTDRVYGASGKLIGSRAVFETGDSADNMRKVASAKQGSDDIRLTKFFKNQLIYEKCALIGVNTGSAYKARFTDIKMYYNHKGLPMPDNRFQSSLPSSNMSLRAMIDWKNVNLPKYSYVRPEFKLQKLDINITNAKTLFAPIDTDFNSVNTSLGAFLDKNV